MTKFHTIVADCPWQFDDKLPGIRGADSHYSTLPIAAIKSFPLPPVATDAVLFMWRVASMAEESYEVVRAWGFVPKTEIIWKKTTGACEACKGEGWSYEHFAGEDGGASPRVWCEACSGRGWKKRHFGMGRIVRAEHETCIVATRGQYTKLVKSHATRSVFEAAPDAAYYLDAFESADLGMGIFEAEATRKHSQKPEVFFDLVESLVEGPYLELFARRQRPGWTCWGNEAGS